MLRKLNNLPSTFPLKEQSPEIFSALRELLNDKIQILLLLILQNLLHGLFIILTVLENEKNKLTGLSLAMSKRSLQREMERAGISWREYKRFRRMKLAMVLLKEKEHQIGEVAEMTDYSSTAHFSKAFKEVVGKSPSQWHQNN